MCFVALIFSFIYALVRLSGLFKYHLYIYMTAVGTNGVV